MDPKLLRKVKQLLALGESDNENESAVAVAQAQRLMDKHRITEAMLEDSGSEEPREEVESWEDPLDTGKRKSTWKSRLGWQISKANGVKMFNSSYGRWQTKLVGRASDVQTVRYLYAYCVREIERLAKKKAGNGRTWINNYRLGCVDTITQKLKSMKRDLHQELRNQSTGMALVRVNDAIQKVERRYELSRDFAKRMHGLKPGRGSYARHDAGAREQGRCDARDINLSRGHGLGAGSRGRLPS